MATDQPRAAARRHKTGHSLPLWPSASPFLKWAGGKARLASTVVARSPATFRAYHEPFVGGGAVFFAASAARPGLTAFLSDANEELIACYRAVRDSLEPLLQALFRHQEAYFALSEEGRRAYYDHCRAQDPADPAERAARTIFLNRTCYNGLYRVNASGRFNVPHGRYARPRVLDEPGLRAASAALHGACLSCEDFEAACSRALPGAFVYLDPPYQPLSATSSFTAYTATSFREADQRRLRDVVEGLTRNGVAVLLSNSDHPFVRSLYEGSGFTIEVVEMSRAINAKGDARAPIPELLIANLARPEVRAALER